MAKAKHTVKKQKLDRKFREQTSSSLQSWGNMVFVGLVIAQFIPGDKPLNLGFIILGLIGMTSAYYASEKIMKGGDA